MSSKRYPEEFKIEAVKQVTERGHSVAVLLTESGRQHTAFMHGLNDMVQAPRNIKQYPMKMMKFIDSKKSYKESLKSAIY